MSFAISFSAFLIALVLTGCGGDSVSQSDAPVAVTEAKVSVVRDTFNQPSIRVDAAPSALSADEAVIETQGYEEASEGFRFVQMDLLRRRSTGRLSELFGPPPLKPGDPLRERDATGREMSPAEVFDREVLSTGLALAAERSAAKIRQHHPEEWKLLEAFARGVNRALGEMEQKHPEILRTYRGYAYNAAYFPPAWRPEDSVAIAAAVGFQLSSTFTEKLGLGILAIANGLTSGQSDADFFTKFDLRPLENVFSEGSRATVAFPARWAPEPKRRGKKLDLWRMFLPNWLTSLNCTDENRWPMPACSRQTFFGSNNWVVSPKFTGTGEAILANDPHLALTFPTTFYEVALNSKPAGGSLQVRGLNLPGIPGILIGHNEDIAWGLTNLGADVDDLYLEQLDPSGTQTLTKVDGFDETFEPMTALQSTLSVRQKDGSLLNLPFRLRMVRNQRPLVSDHYPMLIKFLEYANRPVGGIRANNPANDGRSGIQVSYRWTGHEGSTELAQMLKVNRSKNFAEFRSALEHFDVGAQNFVYADRDGNIGYFAHGKFPLRPYLSLETPPYLPVAGSGGFEWEGYRTRVPELYNPEEGRIVTANNDPFGHSAKPYLSELQDYFGAGFSTGIRAKRITDLLEEKRADGVLTVAEVQAIQTDHYDLLAEKFLTLLRENWEKLELTDEEKGFTRVLLSWNRQAKRDETAPVLFYAWLHQIASEFLHDIHGLPKKLETLVDDPASSAAMVAGLTELINRITDSTPGVKTAYHKLRDGLGSEETSEQTLGLLKLSLQKANKHADLKKLKGVRWGTVHRVKFKNMFEGIIPAMLAVPIERDGAWDTVDVAAGGNNAPNFRLTLSLKRGQPIEGFNVLPGGNYGPLDRENVFRELMMWRDGQIRSLVRFHTP